MKIIAILSLFIIATTSQLNSAFATTPSIADSPQAADSSPEYLDLFVSPFKKPALKIWLYSTPVLIGLRLHREDTVNHNQAEVAQNNSLRENSKYGDYAGRLYTNLAYTGAFGLAGYYSDPMYYTNAKAMFWASAMSGLTAQILKGVVQERRPPPHHDQPYKLNSSKESFPSGHTTSAFAFASVVQQFHGWEWGVPAYALGSFVGWSRMNDNKHYLHDVVFGAILGTTYGLGVSHLYKKSSDGTPPQQSLLLVPNEDRGGELVYTLMF
jgi:membrane-associated phospholipid phosphatase